MTESRYIDPEDEAFNEIERQAKQRKEAVRVALLSIDRNDLMSFDEGYASGWNSALDMAATMVENDFRDTVGAHTRASMAMHIRKMKK